ncbi:uncharacterized protein BDZ99DRAFT_525822 [Mytilinidion resinicola]|uniref:Uncharacterized protein n=1 Tax=Mytilinidion resinicola TaxID=574789 RepID=A0A6A6Y6B8_9PEZI|nr:uncharacterized protein BDZ99DRAFT_525822 [Mytilinidion resinicola]KAF2804230.1 hypothetical protein BDZ99DRAFT_525822 [Mytilinidion resinicola]
MALRVGTPGSLIGLTGFVVLAFAPVAAHWQTLFRNGGHPTTRTPDDHKQKPLRQIAVAITVAVPEQKQEHKEIYVPRPESLKIQEAEACGWAVSHALHTQSHMMEEKNLEEEKK